MAMRTSYRKTELVPLDRFYRVLRAGALTTKQVSARLGLSKSTVEHVLRALPGVHRSKIGKQKHVWSLE